MSSENDSLLSFMSMTGTDGDVARKYLESHGWNVERSVNAFLDGSGVGESAASGVCGDVEKVMKEQGVDRVTAEAIVSAGGGASGDDEVRAPIAAVTGRLFDTNAGFNYGSNAGAGGASVSFRNFELEARQLEAQKRAEEQKRLEAASKGLGTSAAVFKDDDYGFEYEEDDDEDEDEDMEDRSRNLHTLFEPPREILFQGSFAEARSKATSDRRWVLVNIQKDSEFFSYVLNRDLWSNEMIQDIVKSGFVFYQHELGDEEAKMYERFYKPEAYPHVAIIDPRTGEKMIELNLKTRANDPNDLQSTFLEKVSAFLDSHSMTPKRPGSVTPPNAPAPAPIEKPPPTPPPQQVEKNTYQPLEPEPEKGAPNTTQIRVRMFDGKVVNRTFTIGQKVGQLFALVHSNEPSTEMRKFDIMSTYPQRSLQDIQDQTLEEAKLLRATLTVKWLN
mmetsp:Transcript_20779/g.34355  ORF Transcript_20779/g.34355 Transcript_20779/m.34355 type:complete len:446 (-) Transcript_20779:1461-2798(-)